MTSLYLSTFKRQYTFHKETRKNSSFTCLPVICESPTDLSHPCSWEEYQEKFFPYELEDQIVIEEQPTTDKQKLKLLSKVFSKVGAKNFLKRRVSTSTTDSIASIPKLNSSSSSSSRRQTSLAAEFLRRNTKRFKWSSSSSSSYSSDNSTVYSPRIPQSALFSNVNLPSPLQSNSSSTITLSSFIQIHVNIHWSSSISLTITIPRDTSFREFKSTISEAIGDQIPSDVVALKHSSRLSKLETQLLLSEPNGAFVDYLVTEEKLTRVAIDDCWRASLLWWNESVIVTVFSRSRL
ncbi:hypothetical protein G9A89_005291 [Geosiphon pyriformis]|nr:hypothetical protein G9A89_005291 [Geosiphon pyriformis]